MKLKEAIENNRAWATKRIDEDPMFFKRLARSQKPSILYIGCSDSRATAEEMLGAGPDDLFVHRNIANLIPNNDHSSNTVINFAIHDLGVKSITPTESNYLSAMAQVSRFELQIVRITQHREQHSD